MAMPVLATKLFVPPPRSHAVSRPRLIEKLDEGVAAGHKLTLISAPAGSARPRCSASGSAARRRADPDSGRLGLLDESDNDPVRFLSYLVAAFTAANDEPVRSSDATRSAESTLTSLVNDAARESGPNAARVGRFSADRGRIRSAMRSPSSSIMRRLVCTWRSRAGPIRCCPSRGCGLATSSPNSGRPTCDSRRTKPRSSSPRPPAWSSPRKMSPRSRLEPRGGSPDSNSPPCRLRERPDTSEFVSAFTGSNRFVIDYLIEEVLERAPLHVREFLCQTAILDRLSGPLCDAVTGDADGVEMLATLERANLFVVPLDDQRQWYRYHHLFADVLKVRLLAHGVAHVNALHSRASDWFERHGSPEEAVRHALAGSDFPRAARLIESTIPSVRKSRQDATLLGLARTSCLHPSIDARPVLRVFAAWASLVAGDVAAVEPQLAAAEEQLASAREGGAHESEPGEELDSLPVTIALYRGALAMAAGDTTAIGTHAQHALDVAASDDYLGRGAAAGMLGLAAWASGDLEAGTAAFRESASNLRHAGNLLDALSTTMVVGGHAARTRPAHRSEIGLRAGDRRSRRQPTGRRPARRHQ